MSDSLLKEYLGLQVSWGDKTTISFEDFMGFYQEILSNQTPYFRFIYSNGQQAYTEADLAQLNLEDAHRVFAIYDDSRKGMIPANELKLIISDMGYNQVNEPILLDYFEEINKQADIKNVFFK